MSNVLKKSLMSTLALGALATATLGAADYSLYGRSSRRGGSNTIVLKHSVSGGDHSHLLNGQSKYRKGFGTKKLTRAQRKKMRYLNKKRDNKNG